MERGNKMSKPISNSAFKRMILAMPADQQQETISRQLRILPQMIMDETAKLPPYFNPSVVKELEGKLKTVQSLWTDILIARHAA